MEPPRKVPAERVIARRSVRCRRAQRSRCHVDRERGRSRDTSPSDPRPGAQGFHFSLRGRQYARRAAKMDFTYVYVMAQYWY